ncbi:hypothetical protein NIASO_05805 [Niabella soli DSM 19437]|uniref:Uncharacterized protein n=1 Tax=Niabella soli DSM 19437 TaxID=929713 RepID=W0F7K3_9BACT|nr:hypothetical protein NIASO_05805 [Niabella soli DSM 19437]
MLIFNKLSAIGFLAQKPGSNKLSRLAVCYKIVILLAEDRICSEIPIILYE